MSKILRRPMFRGGGKVSSYGNGITTGLANGGMPAKRGLVNGPGGYAGAYGGGVGYKTQAPGASGLFSLNDVLNQTGAPMTGAQILAYAQNKGMNLGNRGINLRSMYIPDTVNTQVGEDEVEKSYAEIVAESGVPKYNDPDEIYPGSGDTQGSLGDNQRFGTNEEVAKNLALGKIDTSLTNNNSVLENQNKVTDDAELSLDEIKDALGSKKAFGRDTSDMLLGFAGAEGDTVSEKFKSFAAAEAKKGPSRTEQIDQAAATFMLKDKFQTKRDKAKVNLMRADVDYKIAAGKELNISESIYEATKNGASTDRKIAIGIQRATSPTTGERYKFKGIIDATNLEAVLDSKKLKTGDTLLVKTTTRDKKTGTDKTIKKIIEIQEDGTAKEIFNL